MDYPVPPIRRVSYRTDPNTRARARFLRRHRYVTATPGSLGRSTRLTRMRVPHEVKYLDTNFAGIIQGEGATTFAGMEVDPATVLAISAPAQGNGPSDRDGHVIVITGMHLAGVIRRVSGVPTTQPQPSLVRLWVVLDTQTNGAQLNSEDVFVNTNNNDFTIATPLKNMAFGRRFKVLATRTFVMPAHVYQADAGPLYHCNGSLTPVNIMLKKLRIPVRFNASTAGVANVVDNSIHVIAVHSDAGVTASFGLQYNCRVRFVG